MSLHQCPPLGYRAACGNEAAFPHPTPPPPACLPAPDYPKESERLRVARLNASQACLRHALGAIKESQFE